LWGSSSKHVIYAYDDEIAEMFQLLTNDERRTTNDGGAQSAICNLQLC